MYAGTNGHRKQLLRTKRILTHDTDTHIAKLYF